ncbi:MAG: ABC transporter permease [Bacilli bacterium]
MSNEHKLYLKKLKKQKHVVLFFKIFIIFLFLGLWEVCARVGILNSFLTSYPSKIFITISDLFKENNLLSHIWVTLYETVISFSLASIIGIAVSSILWSSKTIAKILDPYLTVLNSLPKISLGPLIIIWVGANVKSIIFMALLIAVFTTIINMYNSFINTDPSKITLMKSFGASKITIFTKLIFRGNIPSLINTLKINISLSLIGVIMGELLVSKQGLGYLITYGSQVFNLNLVITSIFILAIMSYILYILIDLLEKKIK